MNFGRIFFFNHIFRHFSQGLVSSVFPRTSSGGIGGDAAGPAPWWRQGVQTSWREGQARWGRTQMFGNVAPAAGYLWDIISSCKKK